MEAPRPNYGISRIDQPEKKNHGFYVRITHRGNTRQKYFPDKANGGKAKALAAARAYRDAIVRKLPKSKQLAASRKRRRVKQSGVTGVTHVVSKTGGKTVYEYWQAAWIDESGSRRTAKFSIGRYGNDTALELAKKARRAAMRAMGAKSGTPRRKAKAQEGTSRAKAASTGAAAASPRKKRAASSPKA